MIAELLKYLSGLDKHSQLSDQELREIAKHVARDPELTKTLTEDAHLQDRLIHKIDLDGMAKKVIRRGEMIFFVTIWGIVAAVFVWYYTNSLLKKSFSTINSKVDATLTHSYNEITNKVNAQLQLPAYSNLLVTVGSTQLQPIIESAKSTLHDDISRIQTNIPNELLESLYSNIVFEHFTASDTNHVISYQATNGGIQLAIKLTSVPIRKSLQVFVEPGDVSQGPKQLMPDPSQILKNVMFMRIVGYDPTRITLAIQYVKDTRVTNLFKNIELQGQNILLDGQPVIVTPN